MKRALTLLMTLLVATAWAEDAVITDVRVDVDAFHREVRKKVVLGADGFIRSEFSQVGVGIEPSARVKGDWLVNARLEHANNSPENNFSSFTGGWAHHAYTGYSDLFYGEVLYTHRVDEGLELRAGPGYYYNYRREGFIGDDASIWEARIRGPYAAVALSYAFREDIELRMEHRYVFADLQRYTVESGVKEKKTEYNDYIYNGVYELAYEVSEAWEVGLGYEYEETRALDGDAKTTTDGHALRLTASYSF